jgi:hypothetical protein
MELAESAARSSRARAAERPAGRQAVGIGCTAVKGEQGAVAVARRAVGNDG